MLEKYFGTYMNKVYKRSTGRDVSALLGVGSLSEQGTVSHSMYV
jgi:hypothetical protein